MLTAEHLSFGFPGRQILDAVSFALHPRTITCLLGGNGAGKTTLFNIITSVNSRLGPVSTASAPYTRFEARS